MNGKEFGGWFLLAMLAILLASDLLNWSKQRTVAAMLAVFVLALLALWILAPR